MALTHSFGEMTNKMVRAGGRSLVISTKASIMICNKIRGMKISDAKRLIDDVIAHKRAIVFTRFTDGVGHRAGKMASGRYPEKAVLAFKKLLVNLENNAQQKGLSVEDLKIVHAVANGGVRRGRFGRQSRRMAKSTHLDLVAEEVVAKKVTAKPKAAPKPKAKSKVEEKVKVEVKPKVEEKPKAEAKQEVKTDLKPEAKKEPQVKEAKGEK